VQNLEFQEFPLNERRDTAKKVHCSSSKVHFILDWSRPNVQVLQDMGLGAMYGVSGIPFSGRRDKTKNVLGSSSKRPFIIDRHKLRYKCCKSRSLSAEYGVAGKSIQWKNRYS